MMLCFKTNINTTVFELTSYLTKMSLNMCINNIGFTKQVNQTFLFLIRSLKSAVLNQQYKMMLSLNLFFTSVSNFLNLLL